MSLFRCGEDCCRFTASDDHFLTLPSHAVVPAMSARVRVGGALALISSENRARAEQISVLEEERAALETSLNEALARGADAAAEAQRASALVGSLQSERDAALAAAASAQAELSAARAAAATQQSQHELLLERLQQLILDLNIADERARENSAEVVRLTRVSHEQQSEIKSLFDECAVQRARADAAAASLGAALAQERERSAALASSSARKEVRGGVRRWLACPRT